jgi:hypothetical protein
VYIQCARMPAGLFTKDSETIAESLCSKELSPGGPASGLRLLTFYMRHAAKGLSAAQRRNLEKARKLLSDRLTQDLRERERRRAA